MKKILILSFMLFIVFAVVACGQNGAEEADGGTTEENSTENAGSEAANENEESTSDNHDETYQVRIGHVNPSGEPTHEAFLWIEEELEKRSDGRLEVELYPDGQLGSENEMFEMVSVGNLEMSAASAPSAHYSPLEIFYVPYLFQEESDWQELLDNSSIGEELTRGLEEETGVRVAGWWSTGVRHMFGQTPVRTPEDAQGLKVRVMERPVMMEVFEYLGMSPTPLPYPEVYSAMQTGVIDAAENDPLGYKFMSFYEVGPYYSLTSHISMPKVIAMNPDFYEGLPADLQAVVDEVMAEGEALNRQLFIDLADDEIEWMKEQEDIHVIDDVDLAAFEEVAREMWPQLQGVDQDLMQEVREFLGRD